MFSKRTLIGGLVAFLVLFIANWLLWGLIFMSTWESMTTVPLNTEPDMVWLTIGYLVYGWLFAYIYPLGYEGGGAAGEGIRFGVVMWGVASLATGMVMQSFTPDSMTAFIFGQFVNLVVYVLMGIALAMVMERFVEPETAAAPTASTTPPPEEPEGF